jgi:acetyl esterase/lipase
MTSAAEIDARLDPRVRVFWHAQPEVAVTDVADRDELLADVASPEGRAMLAAEAAFMDTGDSEAVAPSTGLRFSSFDIRSSPDDNTITLHVIRPDDDVVRPCVYYIHGGAMASLSCTYGSYRAWGRLVAAQGVVVVMVEFRNAVSPSSVPDVAPYPAGLHDCLSGVRYVHAAAESLGVDATRIVVSGESGGGNLTIATAMRLRLENELHFVKGLYVFCPYINGSWPDDRYPSSSAYIELLSDIKCNRGRVGYGIDAFDARDPMAWPGFATARDLTGFPPTVISVNECDPLRDEGVAFYRLLLEAGVSARGREVLGTMHATEMFPTVCPEISAESARALAAFAAD